MNKNPLAGVILSIIALILISCDIVFAEKTVVGTVGNISVEYRGLGSAIVMTITDEDGKEHFVGFDFFVDTNLGIVNGQMLEVVLSDELVLISNRNEKYIDDDGFVTIKKVLSRKWFKITKYRILDTN